MEIVLLNDFHEAKAIYPRTLRARVTGGNGREKKFVPEGPDNGEGDKSSYFCPASVCGKKGNCCPVFKKLN
jgi:hypothetical protein